MKTKFNLFTIAVIVFFVSGCSNSSSSSSCPNPELLGLRNVAPSGMTNSSHSFENILFPTITSTILPSISFLDPVYPNNVDIHNGTYNAVNGDYVNIAPYDHKLITITAAGVFTQSAFNINTPTGSAPDSSVYQPINAPVFLNGNLYFGYFDRVGTSIPKQAVFGILDSNYNLITAPTPTINLPQSSINYYPSYSSCTDGIRYIYFMIGTNLVTYDSITNTTTATQIAIATPANFNVNGNLIGIRYVSQTKLYVLKESWTVTGEDTKLLELDITNPTNVIANVVFDLQLKINPEFYSTAYDDCTKKFFITSSDGSGTLYRFLQIDLSGTPTLSTAPLSATYNPSTDYLMGITLKQ